MGGRAAQTQAQRRILPEQCGPWVFLVHLFDPQAG